MNLKQIAAHLRQAATTVEDWKLSQDYDWSWDRFELQIDGLTVRCPNYRGAVLQLAAKFERGLPREGRTFVPPGRRQTSRAKCSIQTFLSFWEDGEHENARAYLALYPNDEWPAKAVALLEQEAAA